MRLPYGEDNIYKTEYVAELIKHVDSEDYDPDEIKVDLDLSFMPKEKKRKYASRGKMHRQCVVCGKWFYTNSSIRIICSGKCRNVRLRQLATNPVRYRKNCAICGNEFESNLPHAKCCSEKCLKARKLKNSKQVYYDNKE